MPHIAVSLLTALVLAAPPPMVSAAGTAVPDPYIPLRASLLASRQELGAHLRTVEQLTGMAVDLEARLDADLGSISAPVTPPNWTDAEYLETNTDAAALDASLANQLSTSAFHEIRSVRGLDEVFVRSPADGTMQPVSLYVPTTYDPAKATPLVVFLHGRGWSEVDMLSVPFVRNLAESTGVIVAAPYARGDIMYADPAPADVYAAVDAVEHALNVDRNRVYLAGHSMGGFGVFEVGPLHPEVWSALMCVSGSLTNEDRDEVARTFRSKTVYVVSGVKDDNIPHRYSQLTVQYLRDARIATRFYAEPSGGHSMASFRPALGQAWHDMISGVRADSGHVDMGSNGGLPPLPTIMPFKP